MTDKLESIISGYRINADDAAWLRSLAETGRRIIRPNPDAKPITMEAARKIIDEHRDTLQALKDGATPVAAEPEPLTDAQIDAISQSVSAQLWSEWHPSSRLEWNRAFARAVAAALPPGPAHEQSAFEKAARLMNETGQGEHGWAQDEAWKLLGTQDIAGPLNALHQSLLDRRAVDRTGPEHPFEPDLLLRLRALSGFVADLAGKYDKVVRLDDIEKLFDTDPSPKNQQEPEQ